MYFSSMFTLTLTLALALAHSRTWHFVHLSSCHGVEAAGARAEDGRADERGESPYDVHRAAAGEVDHADV